MDRTLQIAVNPPSISRNSKKYILEDLTSFFEKTKHGLVRHGDLKLYIWRKSKLNFFVYDPSGRNSSCKSDFKDGLPCLITLQNLTNVTHLIKNLSDLRKNDLFEICELRLEKMETENFKTDYRVMNKQKAVLIGISKNQTISSFISSVSSIIYTKISPSNEWKSKTIDRILCLGNSLIENENVDINNFPNPLYFGKYSVELNIKPSVQSGIIEELLKALKIVFQSNENFILEISDIFYSIWKFNDLFYLFIPSEYKLEMHSSLSSLKETILKSFSLESSFDLHEIDLMRVLIFADKFDHKCFTEDENLKFVNLSSPMYSGVEILSDLKELSKSSFVEPKSESEIEPDIAESSNVGLNDTIFCDKIIDEIIESCIPIENMIKAERIFPKTDLGHLKEMRRKLIHGIDEKLEKSDTKIQSKDILLEIETNFQELPDGSEIISGTKNLEEINISELFIGLSSILISQKYVVSTWDINVVDLVITTAVKLSETIQINERILYEKKLIQLPDMKLGSTELKSNLRKICSGKFGVLRKMLEDSFNNYSKLLIIGSHFCSAVFRESNFYYLFLGYPCDSVGFRDLNNQSGFASFIRFRTLKSLFLRIVSNRGNLDDSENILMCAVNITEISVNSFEAYTESENELIAGRILKEITIFTEKLDALNDEINSEISRRNLYRKHEFIK